MKKACLILFGILTTLSVYTQNISGKWNGILEVQEIQLRLVFNISQTEMGYTATMDSPDQGVKEIPVTSISYENQRLNIGISNAGIKYEGLLNEENVFVGTFKQGGQSIPFNLTKERLEAEKPTRPQEPVSPYEYYTEDVTFENKKDEIILAGILSLPEEDGNFPAVVLISGSGPQNRDEELLGHKPFLILSDYLTKNGIAVLRFDDRGTAESTGDFGAATSFDFANDVESAIEYLKTRKEIDKNKIGLIGHSEGGLIAPMVASKSKDVDFIVLLAGTGIRGDQLLLLQQELVGRASGISENDLTKIKEINEVVFDMILKSDDVDVLEKELTEYIEQCINNYPQEVRSADMSDEKFIELQVTQLLSPWMCNFIKYDPAPTLEMVKCPVLAINGEKDLQVPPVVNLDAIKKALEKGGNKNVTTKQLSDLNHLFQECETGSPDEYAKIEQTFSPIALKEILNWILIQVQ